jgi:hypothetical protein
VIRRTRKKIIICNIRHCVDLKLSVRKSFLMSNFLGVLSFLKFDIFVGGFLREDGILQNDQSLFETERTQVLHRSKVE